MRELKDSKIEWIGAIPADWEMIRTKNKFRNHKDIAGSAADSYERLALTLNGVIKRSKEDSTGLQPEAFNGYQILRAGELVFKLIDLENISTSRVGLSAFTGIVSPAYIVLTPLDGINASYAQYFFLSMWQREVFNHMGDDGVRSSLNAKDLLNIPLTYPSLAEQERIAAFLDRECSEIDALITRTRESIAEYKKLKQAVITQAVTKGIRGERSMKDSGVEWLGIIPAAWRVHRIANLYDERSESGLNELPILTVSINTGVSDYEIADEDKERVFIRCEDRTKYKRVYPGDLTYNMMRAWQGAFGAVRVNGMVSPAYVVAKPKAGVQIDSRYIEALLRTQEATEEMHRYSRGIVDFRLRLYWPEFKNIRICLPDLEEQSEIADYIDEKVAAIDKLIAQKEQFITELQNYKKTLIYEYVSGKKEVPAERAKVTAVIYPYFPAVLNTKKARFAQAVLAGRILDKCRVKMGRVKLEKMLYTIETSIGFDFDTEYVRQTAGPLDDSVYDCEGIISRKNKWYTIKQSGYGVSYKPAKDNSKYLKYYDKYFASYDSEIERIINIFMNFDADQAEIIATLFAAWNDFIIDKKQFTDEDLVDEVRNNWHDSKKRFSAERWLAAIKHMREINLVPQGYGKRTVINHEG